MRKIGDPSAAAVRAKEYARHDEILQLAQELVRIPSFDDSVGEARVADHLRTYLGRAGIATVLDEVLPGRPNLIAQIGSG